MKSLNDIKAELLNYIAHEQVAFQFGDGLVCFTKPRNDYDSSDIELGLLDQVKQLISHISVAQSISVIDRKSLLDDKLGFAEFADWSNNNDTLILVDDSLLICIPDSPKTQSLFIS
jgi:hypothetical protein